MAAGAALVLGAATGAGATDPPAPPATAAPSATKPPLAATLGPGSRAGTTDAPTQGTAGTAALEVGEPSPVEGTPAAPTVTLPFLPDPSVLVRPPAGTPASTASRDCGFGIPLSDGNELWVFCDTTDLHDAGGRLELTYFANNTAAITTPDDPLTLRERWDDQGRPVPFISPVPSYAPCPAPMRHVIWPISGTSVPAGAIDRVWVYFENICQDPVTLGGWSASVGVAEMWYLVGDPDPVDVPLQATVRDPDLFPMGAEPFRLWGTGAVWGRDGYVYVHRCATGGAGCQAARVPTELVPGDTAYRFWDGDSWEVDPPTGPTMDMGPGLTPFGSHHVLWLPEMGVYAMAHAAGGAGSTAVVVQVAARPEGPWSAGVIIPVTGCGQGFKCYTAAIHGQGSGIDHVAVSIYDSSEIRADGLDKGATRLVRARVDVDPPPPGVCRSSFRDVWSDHPFCTDIAWARLAGVVDGRGDRSFGPGGAVSRQAAVAMAWRAAGEPTGPFPDPGFADVGPTHPFATPLAWAASAGIVTGYADGRFGPTDAVTRQSLAAVLWRWQGQPAAAPAGFTDVGPGHPFHPPVSWLAGVGITTGYPDGSFRPTAVVSRQGAAAFLHRLLT